MGSPELPEMVGRRHPVGDESTLLSVSCDGHMTCQVMIM